MRLPARCLGRVDCSEPFISKWRKRFVAERLAGLYLRHTGRPVTVLTPKVEARILDWTRRMPTDGTTHWNTRPLAKKLSIRHMMVARTRKKHGIQPHRMERYMASNDPDFEEEAADVIGLYLTLLNTPSSSAWTRRRRPPALDRKDPVVPLSPGRAERHGFEYIRHGTPFRSKPRSKIERDMIYPVQGMVGASPGKMIVLARPRSLLSALPRPA